MNIGLFTFYMHTHTYLYIYMAFSRVIVTFEEMDTATGVHILDKTLCIAHKANTLEKGMKPIILHLAMVR